MFRQVEISTAESNNSEEFWHIYIPLIIYIPYSYILTVRFILHTKICEYFIIGNGFPIWFCGEMFLTKRLFIYIHSRQVIGGGRLSLAKNSKWRWTPLHNSKHISNKTNNHAHNRTLTYKHTFIIYLWLCSDFYLRRPVTYFNSVVSNILNNYILS